MVRALAERVLQIVPGTPYNNRNEPEESRRSIEERLK